MSSDVSLCALTTCVAAAMLVGCGGSQPPSGAPGAMPQAPSITGRADRGGSRTLAQASSRGSLYVATYKVTKPLLYVTNCCETRDSAVTVYEARDNNPKPIATITDNITEPAGDCIDGDGTLYVVNEGINSYGWVSEFLLGKTRASKVITKGIDGPAFCAIDSQGNLWVTNINLDNVTEYLKGSSKPHTTITNGLTYADGIAIDHSGNIYIGNLLTTQPNIQVFPPGKKSPSRTITDGITWPVGITVDAHGTLYVANLASCNIEEYRAGQSKPYREITGDNFGPDNATVNKDGWLYVADLGGDGCASKSWKPTILEFRPQSIKPSPREIESGLGYPEGLAYYPPLLP